MSPGPSNEEGGFLIEPHWEDGIDYVLEDPYGSQIPINKEDILDLLKVLRKTRDHGLLIA